VVVAAVSSGAAVWIVVWIVVVWSVVCSGGPGLPRRHVARPGEHA
jgi:hypothetical protein